MYQLLPFFKKCRNWKNLEKIAPHIQPKFFLWHYFPKLLMYSENSINLKQKILNKPFSISYRSAMKNFWFFFSKKSKFWKISQNVPEAASLNFVIYPLQPKSTVFEIFASQFPLHKNFKRVFFQISLNLVEKLIPGAEFDADSKYCHLFLFKNSKNDVTYIYVLMTSSTIFSWIRLKWRSL